jgi:hypothetical protein
MVISFCPTKIALPFVKVVNHQKSEQCAHPLGENIDLGDCRLLEGIPITARM